MLGHVNEFTQQKQVKKPSGSQFVPLKNGIQVCLLHRILECGYLSNAPLSPKIFTSLEPVSV